MQAEVHRGTGTQCRLNAQGHRSRMQAEVHKGPMSSIKAGEHLVTGTHDTGWRAYGVTGEGYTGVHWRSQDGHAAQRIPRLL